MSNHSRMGPNIIAQTVHDMLFNTGAWGGNNVKKLTKIGIDKKCDQNSDRNSDQNFDQKVRSKRAPNRF